MSVLSGLLATWRWSGRRHGCVDWIEGRVLKSEMGRFFRCDIFRACCITRMFPVCSQGHASIMSWTPRNTFLFCKDDFTAEVAKLKEDETTSVKQFEAGQLEGFFGSQQSYKVLQLTVNLLTAAGSQTFFGGFFFARLGSFELKQFSCFKLFLRFFFA